MPAVSRAEERYLYALKGPAWVKTHHFNTPMAGLPEHKGDPIGHHIRKKKRRH